MMKKLISFFSVILLGVFFAGIEGVPQDEAPMKVSGTWQGTLSIMGVTLRVAFRITLDENGYHAELDSPDQGVRGIAVKEVIVRGDSLALMVPAVMGQYAGRWRADSLDFAGIWKQGGLTLPLILKSAIAGLEPKRPQTPKKPYPYREEDVTFENKEAAITLAGTLTLPYGSGPFPSAILISGSGPQDRDEQIFDHRPFLILADHLTREGFAVLRYDDRGVGQSTGDFKTATTLDFVGDARAAFDFLQTRKDIRTKKIGLIGHSEGGMVATMLAAGNKEVAFIILLAGLGTTGEELLMAQSELIFKASGMDDSTLTSRLHLQNRLYRLIIEEEDVTRLQQTLRQEIQAYAVEAVSHDTDSTGISPELMNAQIRQLTSPWFRFFLTYDPAPYLSAVTCPALALNGGLDLQVPAEENLRGIETAIKAGGNNNVTTHLFPGLNHLFQTAKTGLPSEYAQIEETVSPAVLMYIAQWLKKTL